MQIYCKMCSKNFIKQLKLLSSKFKCITATFRKSNGAFNKQIMC